MDKKKWLKLTINCTPQLVEPVSDFVLGVVEAGVETGAPDEPHYGTVQVYVSEPDPDEREIARIVETIDGQLANLAAIFGVEKPTLAQELIVEEDWGKSWKEHFKPLPIVPGLTIVPSWEQYEQTGDELVIVMDPGMAFGTGHHATTALCAGFLQDLAQNKPLGRVLDVGTGTGILAMAAALFDAGQVYGIDNDPEAVKAATENVAGNNLQEKVAIDIAPLATLSGNYDTIVANIISSVLLEMADDLTRLLAAGGQLILSGILAGAQEQEVIAGFRKRGLIFVESRQQKEWVALYFNHS